MGVMSHPSGGGVFIHLWVTVHTCTVGCAIRITLVGVRLHPLDLQWLGTGLASRWSRVRFPRPPRLVLGWVDGQTISVFHPNHPGIDPSAAADRRIRRRIFVRRKSAEKITARRISRRILLAVNPPQMRFAADFFCIVIAVHQYALLIFLYFLTVRFSTQRKWFSWLLFFVRRW